MATKRRFNQTVKDAAPIAQCRIVRLDDEPLKEWIYYICDERCLEVHMAQLEPRRFSGYVIMAKSKKVAQSIGRNTMPIPQPPHNEK